LRSDLNEKEVIEVKKIMEERRKAMERQQ